MINRLVLENLRHRPLRTLLGVAAIGLEVTLMLTVVGLSRGMLEDSARRARGAGADIIVRPPGTSVISLSSAPMSDKLLPFFRQQPHVTRVTGTVVHPLVALSAVTGIDLEEFNAMSGGFRYLSGGPFERPDDILVDEFYARQNGLKVGGPLQLMNRTWRVCGIVESGKLSRIFLPIKILQELTGNTGKLSQIYVQLDDNANVKPVVQSLRAVLKDYHIYSAEEFLSLFSVSNVPGARAFIGVVIGLSVVVGFLVVFLSMYTAVLERTREIGVLKALGASPAYVLNLLARETTLLAIAGVFAGIGLSYVTRWLIETLVPASMQQMIVPEWWPIAGAIALAGALLGALYPGWKAARQDAIEALAYE